MVSVSLPAGLQLYQFQQANLDAWHSMRAPRVLWNCDSLSLGKTVDAVVCAKACNYQRILVVCSASMRPEWEAEFARWWPEREKAAAIDKGFARKTMSAPERVRLQGKLDNPTHIVSPELLPKLVGLHTTGEPGDIAPYDYIVFDELHQLRSYWGKAFQALVTLRKLYPSADLKLLSGTPMGSDPLRAWPWLELSEPGRWGTLRLNEEIPFRYKARYGKKTPSDYAFSGFTYAGVNEDGLPQFAGRVAHLIRRVTPAQVGIQLPDMRFEIKRYPLGDTAALAAVDWAETALEEQSVAIFTRNHEPMAEIEAELGARGLPYVRLYQEHTRAERVALVQQGLADRAVILATTGLVSTGVNYLADIHVWMLAQPSENHVEIQQLSGRFKRLSSKDHLPRVGYLLYQEGAEFSAQKALVEKLKTDKSILAPGADAEALEGLIDGRSKLSFLDSIRLLGRTMQIEGDDDDAGDE